MSLQKSGPRMFRGLPCRAGSGCVSVEIFAGNGGHITRCSDCAPDGESAQVSGRLVASRCTDRAGTSHLLLVASRRVVSRPKALQTTKGVPREVMP
jgi:hypothetical protein